MKTYAYKKVEAGLFTTPVKLKELVPKEHAKDRAGFAKQLRKDFRAFAGL